MVKVATDWSGNPSAEANQFTYNNSAVAYNSTARTFSGVVPADMSADEKIPASWANVAKDLSEWAYNPDFDNNEYPYDSAALYDSAATYDGVTSGESPISTREATVWLVA